MDGFEPSAFLLRENALPLSYTSCDSFPDHRLGESYPRGGRTPFAEFKTQRVRGARPRPSWRAGITSCPAGRGSLRRRASRPGGPPPGAYAPARRSPDHSSPPEGRRGGLFQYTPRGSPPFRRRLRQSSGTFPDGGWWRVPLRKNALVQSVSGIPCIGHGIRTRSKS